MGSSPLSRGIPPVALECGGFVRIIPALAGNTPSVLENSSYLPDHPRSRGEYSEFLDGHCGVVGSSPLSRGIRMPAEWWMAAAGIIPALAGNTCQSARNTALAWDHPRSRGEYVHAAKFVVMVGGSSPLSRGIPLIASTISVPSRIIPALAGNTTPMVMLLSKGRDHPRSRGEYRSALPEARIPPGSSPLSRGIR